MMFFDFSRGNEGFPFMTLCGSLPPFSRIGWMISYSAAY